MTNTTSNITAVKAPGYAFSPCFYTPVVRATHGDSSGVRGAAWLWKDSS